MFDILPTPLPWYLTGPLMGLIIAGIIAGITLRDVVVARQMSAVTPSVPEVSHP
ncbi:MAG: hypothetical protein H0V98_02300 [Chloroflexia bacterium]|jgi:hypothetical protein|nr:hypothetical protein [Chloroflexia bacterium]